MGYNLFLRSPKEMPKESQNINQSFHRRIQFGSVKRNCHTCMYYMGTTYKCDIHIGSQRPPPEPLLFRDTYRNCQLHYRSCHLYVCITHKCVKSFKTRPLTQTLLLFSVTFTAVGLTQGIATSIQNKEHENIKIHPAIIGHLNRIKLVKQLSKLSNKLWCFHSTPWAKAKGVSFGARFVLSMIRSEPIGV